MIAAAQGWNVQIFAELTTGGALEVDAEQAGRILEPVAERFIKLPHNTNGNNTRYSGQYVLVAAVVLGQATVAKEGRSYVYSII